MNSLIQFNNQMLSQMYNNFNNFNYNNLGSQENFLFVVYEF
jgi:hypothetical protein